MSESKFSNTFEVGQLPVQAGGPPGGPMVLAAAATASAAAVLPSAPPAVRVGVAQAPSAPFAAAAAEPVAPADPSSEVRRLLESQERKLPQEYIEELRVFQDRVRKDVDNDTKAYEQKIQISEQEFQKNLDIFINIVFILKNKPILEYLRDHGGMFKNSIRRSLASKATALLDLYGIVDGKQREDGQDRLLFEFIQNPKVYFRSCDGLMVEFFQYLHPSYHHIELPKIEQLVQLIEELRKEIQEILSDDSKRRALFDEGGNPDPDPDQKGRWLFESGNPNPAFEVEFKEQSGLREEWNPRGFMLQIMLQVSARENLAQRKMFFQKKDSKNRVFKLASDFFNDEPSTDICRKYKDQVKNIGKLASCEINAEHDYIRDYNDFVRLLRPPLAKKYYLAELTRTYPLMACNYDFTQLRIDAILRAKAAFIQAQNALNASHSSQQLGERQQLFLPEDTVRQVFTDLSRGVKAQQISDTASETTGVETSVTEVLPEGVSLRFAESVKIHKEIIDALGFRATYEQELNKLRGEVAAEQKDFQANLSLRKLELKLCVFQIINGILSIYKGEMVRNVEYYHHLNGENERIVHAHYLDNIKENLDETQRVVNELIEEIKRCIARFDPAGSYLGVLIVRLNQSSSKIGLPMNKEAVEAFLEKDKISDGYNSPLIEFINRSSSFHERDRKVAICYLLPILQISWAQLAKIDAINELSDLNQLIQNLQKELGVAGSDGTNDRINLPLLLHAKYKEYLSEPLESGELRLLEKLHSESEAALAKLSSGYDQIVATWLNLACDLFPAFINDPKFLLIFVARELRVKYLTDNVQGKILAEQKDFNSQRVLDAFVNKRDLFRVAEELRISFPKEYYAYLMRMLQPDLKLFLGRSGLPSELVDQVLYPARASSRALGPGGAAAAAACAVVPCQERHPDTNPSYIEKPSASPVAAAAAQVVLPQPPVAVAAVSQLSNEGKLAEDAPEVVSRQPLKSSVAMVDGAPRQSPVIQIEGVSQPSSIVGATAASVAVTQPVGLVGQGSESGSVQPGISTGAVLGHLAFCPSGENPAAVAASEVAAIEARAAAIAAGSATVIPPMGVEGEVAVAGVLAAQPFRSAPGPGQASEQVRVADDDEVEPGATRVSVTTAIATNSKTSLAGESRLGFFRPKTGSQVFVSPLIALGNMAIMLREQIVALETRLTQSNKTIPSNEMPCVLCQDPQMQLIYVISSYQQRIEQLEKCEQSFTEGQTLLN